jgi:gamma-glutamyltranspeptidase / glutathione hydrolase
VTSVRRRSATTTTFPAGVGRALRALLLAAAALAILLPGVARAYAGAVASPDRYGADAAEEVLTAGGNAVDAAVAVAFALAVTYPEAGNLGGGGFATVYFRGTPHFLDYRERAPAAATASMYLDAKGEVIPGATTVGARAVAVPGTVMGLWQLHRRFGALPWRRLLEPAIRYARDGFVASALLSQRSADTSAALAGRTNFAAYFGAIEAGATLRQPELASALERIARDGVREFYHGETARLIVAQMARDHGLVTAQDLAAYRAIWRAPLEADWAGYRIITAPPPSSGGIALVALLKMKATIAPLFAGVPLNSPQYVHLLAELEKPVFADRAEYLGDPDFHPVPVARLTDDAYLATRARGISTDRPTPTAAVSAGLQEHHNTTHFSVVDRWGNAVSNTYTLNDDFGSGLVVKGAGFLLNNEMDDFSAKPGTPNLYGVVGGDANAIAPAKTPLSSMTPTILTRDGKVALVIGTPGGSRIFTSVFQVITNWHDFGEPLGEAVTAVRVHHQLLPPDTIFEEPYRQLDPATRRALEARGYRLENQGFNGDIQAIEIAARGATAVADPRGIGVGRVIE